ncbi:PREDICTED: protein PET117 homolog, mitochondrial [Nipponia nippon]|nr:PREDICTED: protein PET117 homolog, mitochondrial [Nipponia nippon]
MSSSCAFTIESSEGTFTLSPPWDLAPSHHPSGTESEGQGQRLHSGVLRDLERQNQKKENIRLLEEQIALTKQLMEERDKALMEEGSQQS